MRRKKRTKRILIIGDSFVEGVGGVDSCGWAHEIQRSFPDFEFVVSGEGGDNTVKLLTRWPKSKFNIIVVQIGTNDSRFRPSISDHEITPGRFSSNLSKIIGKARRRNSAKSVLLVGLFFVDEGLTVPYKEDKIYQNDSIKKYDSLIERAASSNSAKFVSLSSVERNNSLLADGLHPSPDGHAQIATLVSKSLRKELGA
jgi:lysophospholipase L1-like esterase